MFSMSGLLVMKEALNTSFPNFQSVTGTEQVDDHNSYWTIRGKHQDHCDRGQDTFLF